MSAHALTVGKQSARPFLCLFEACSRRLVRQKVMLVDRNFTENDAQGRQVMVSRTRAPWSSARRSACRFDTGCLGPSHSTNRVTWSALRLDQNPVRNGDQDVRTWSATWQSCPLPFGCARASGWPWLPVKYHQFTCELVGDVGMEHKRFWKSPRHHRDLSYVAHCCSAS